jgi:hypothetical protein
VNGRGIESTSMMKVITRKWKQCKTNTEHPSQARRSPAAPEEDADEEELEEAVVEVPEQQKKSTSESKSSLG